MKLRAYLVDDEPLALERLSRLLDETGRVEVVGSTTVPEEAVEALKADPPDVCFLDIQMPRLNGFDVLARLPRQPVVVFTTAYDQYALRAFGVNSVDYLLKPIEPEALDRAIRKVTSLQASAEAPRPDVALALRQIEDSLRRVGSGYRERIASRLGDRIRFLDLSEVTHFYAEDKLTWAVSAGRSYCVDRAICDLEKDLDPRKFFRIHRGTVVNLAWVKEVTSMPGGALNVRLGDARGTDLTVARDRAREFKERIGC